MAKGAKVMLTNNLWQQVGLCNGTRGTVDNLLYAEGQKPPSLPIAIIVDFPDYSGPAFFSNKPKCIPIPPIVHEWHDGLRTLSRQQLSLRLNYAMTIHKSQGQTMTKAVIDIGNKEMAAGCTFVALSRLRTLSGLLIQPMPFKRLKCIGRLKTIQHRINEEKRLTHLAHQL
jgi:ATP-dependent DNA helicase PIF1